MVEFCDKCKYNKLIEEHHLWSKEFDNPHGNALSGYPSRVWLCDKHHREIEQEIIIPILKEYSLRPNYKAKYWLWKYTLGSMRERIIREIVEKSWRWIHGNTN